MDNYSSLLCYAVHCRSPSHPRAIKAKHPLASPWNKKRSILWLPHGTKSEASFGFPLLKGDGRGIEKGDGRGIEKGDGRGIEKGDFDLLYLVEGRQEGKLKAKLEAIPRMMQLGLSVEMIAEGLDLSVEVVQQVAPSFAEQNVMAFIELLNNRRLLFSTQDLAELAELIKPLPDKIETLSDAIAQWCKQDAHSLQRQAWRDCLSGKLAATVEEWLAQNLASLVFPIPWCVAL